MTNIVRMKFKDGSVIKFTKNVYNCAHVRQDINTTSPDYKFSGMQEFHESFTFSVDVKYNTLLKTIQTNLTAQVKIQLDPNYSFADSKFETFISLDEGAYALTGCSILDVDVDSIDSKTDIHRLNITLSYDYFEKVTP